MNEKVFRVLEYQKIIDQLTTYAGSALGKECCKHLTPTNDYNEIIQMQKETSDALTRIYAKGTLSFSGVPDIRASIMRLEVHANLGAGELLRISSVLTATLRAKNYGGSSKEEQDGQLRTDSLTERFSLLEPMSSINNEILRCIVSEEEIADDASAGLKSVRRQMKNINDKIHEQLNAIVNSAGGQGYLQDNIITMRNGRYCIPVKQEYKGQVQGMVHDQSASKSTAFIEPIAVMKLNNDLAELMIKEQDEIAKILASLSAMVGERLEELKYNQSVLTELDFIFARAQLSKHMKAIEPKYNQNHYINIKKGRHPLIEAHHVVPIDIYLGGDFNLLVITGPNTGGKTVSLKTVGLFTLMGQSGLHIPAFDGSELSVFDDVYADIGDEQSIEQSLSTFSSHMTNTVSILKHADENSLVLFDELGAGTDPTEGAALAMAILTYLHRKNIRTMATTHYSELKIFALSTPGVSNACCEFNVETLRPTYRLLIGIPGKSNAFAISQKLGLDTEMIQMAKSFLETKDESFEDVINGLEKNRIAIEKEKEEITAYKREIENLKKKLTDKNNKIDGAKERILREANEQAREILQKAKDYADESIRKMNKLGSIQSAGREMEAERAALREKLGQTSNQTIKASRKKSKEHKPSDFKVGSNVHVISLNLDGTISSLPNAKGDLYVQMGILRSLINIQDLEIIEKEPEKQKESSKTQVGKIRMSKSFSISPELNIIGKRVDEALPDVEKYLDDAYLAHLPKVTIIHGRGTGALKDAVHAKLKRLPYVKSYRLGSFGEGDHGVTIVEFK